MNQPGDQYRFEFSGQGSKFLQGETYATLDEAKAAVDEWVSRADTIGGMGRVVDLSTGKEVYIR